MKCIEKHGDIKRVKDEVAADMVDNKEWSYCPKSKWKEATRKNKK